MRVYGILQLDQLTTTLDVPITLTLPLLRLKIDDYFSSERQDSTGSDVADLRADNLAMLSALRSAADLDSSVVVDDDSKSITSLSSRRSESSLGAIDGFQEDFDFAAYSTVEGSSVILTVTAHLVRF